MEGQVHELATNSLDRAQRFVVLVLDDIALILAQQEIQALEPVLDVSSIPTAVAAAPTKHNAAGMLSLDGHPCLVYALDSELAYLPQIPPQHRICAIMNYRDEPYALSCKEVRLLPRSALGLHDIPRPLLRSKMASPVKWLVISDGHLLLGTTAAALFAHVSRSIDAEIISFDERSRRLRT
jgi:hypothetical protein